MSTPAEVFQHFLHAQTNVAEHTGHLLALTEFEGYGLSWRESGSGRVTRSYTVLKYWLSDTGKQSWYGDGYPGYSGSRHRYPPMSEAQLKETIALIRELPATNTAPPFDDLVLVSLRQGTNWVTYSYDRRSPPKALKRICEISRSGWVRNFTVQ